MRARTARLLLIALSSSLLVLTPAADLLAFGLHDHVAPAERGSALAGPGSADGPTPSHHCELSASIGELLSVVELPVPGLVAIDATEYQAAAPRHRPFVPLTPPRA